MTHLFLDIVTGLHNLICSTDYLIRSRTKPTAFLRVRKMTFPEYIYVIVQNMKSSLQPGLNAFFEAYHDGKISYSKQAFSKGRSRILPEAILELVTYAVRYFYEKGKPCTWNGYHLFGIDGTKLNLPCTPELSKLYDVQYSSGVPQTQALVSCVYDLVHGIIVDTRFESCRANEKVATKDMISNFPLKDIVKPIFIMDRGYPSAKLIDAIINAGYTFIMRCSSEFGKRIPKTGTDCVVDHSFKMLQHATHLRMITIPLPGKETEYLVTNLFDSNITADDFRELYRMRWGIETKYNDIKNKLEVENFTGYTPDSVKQDFYATLLLSNLASIFRYDTHEEIEATHTKPTNKRKYRMNIAATIAELKGKVMGILSTASALSRRKLFKKLFNNLRNAMVAVRPGRSFPRHRQHKSMKFPTNHKHCFALS